MIPTKVNGCKQILFTLFFIWTSCQLVRGEYDSKVHMCCNSTGKVYSDYECLHKFGTTNVSIHCEHGQYTVEKDVDERDNYTIDANEMVFYKSGTRIPYDGYCIGEYMSDNKTLHEVGIVCFVLPEIHISIFIKGILSFISAAFICATLYVYKIIPQLRETQDKVTIICISCLGILFLLLGVLQVTPGYVFHNNLCVMIALLVYFFVIAYFAWLNMVTANVLKSVVLPRWNIRERKWLILNHIYAWSVPIILTIIIIAFQHMPSSGLHPFIGEESCWISDERLWIYIYIPLSLMLAANVIQFIIILFVLLKSSGNVISLSRKKALKYKCKLYFTLFILSGLTWIFEVFSFAFKQLENYWYVTDTMNALHGLLIFVVLVVFRKRIRKELAGKRICCCRIPQEWNRIGDSEECYTDETKQDNINIRSQNGSD